jgi:hypothetical protein
MWFMTHGQLASLWNLYLVLQKAFGGAPVKWAAGTHSDTANCWRSFLEKDIGRPILTSFDGKRVNNSVLVHWLDHVHVQCLPASKLTEYHINYNIMILSFILYRHETWNIHIQESAKASQKKIPLSFDLFIDCPVQLLFSSSTLGYAKSIY